MISRSMVLRRFGLITDLRLQLPFSIPPWEIADGTSGHNNGFSDGVDGYETYNFPLNKIYIPINDNTNIDGNRQFDVALANPTSDGYFFLGQSPGQEIPSGPALGRSAASV